MSKKKSNKGATNDRRTVTDKKAIVLGEDLSQNVLLQPDDTIFLP